MRRMRCDSCTGELGSAGTYYFLATRDVVLSERYWAQLFRASAELLNVFAGSEEQLLTIFGDFVSRMASCTTPWSICESCSEYFCFDRDAARTHAIGRTPPSGTGAVDPSGCMLFAALGWERATGGWPVVVQRPPARDSCDLCAKTMYEGEIDGFVANGEAGGTCCLPCMSRYLAIRDRARHRAP